VYFDDSHDTADAATQIELKWRALRERLEQQGADPALTESIGAAIVDGQPAVGRSGRAVVASADGVLVDEHLIRPTVRWCGCRRCPTSCRWSSTVTSIRPTLSSPSTTPAATSWCTAARRSPRRPST
jgi:hypothetical protein